MKELEKIEVGEPVFIKNLLLYPLHSDGNGIKAFSLEEAIREGKARIEEKDGGKIDEVIFKNLSEEKIFALDGEEIIGALQNRVTNTAFFAEEKSTFSLPVTCVEERRWKGKEKIFSPGEISFATLRAVLCKTTTQSLYKKKSFSSDQSLIWETVKKTLNTFRIKSSTLSMHDTYTSLKSEIEKYIESINFDNANGFVAFAGKKFLCMDYFISKELFRKYKIKLLKGYAVDALMRKNESTEIREKEEIKEFILKLSKGKMNRFPSLSLGEEIRIETDKFIGRGLEYENKLIHVCFFEK